MRPSRESTYQSDYKYVCDSNLVHKVAPRNIKDVRLVVPGGGRNSVRTLGEEGALFTKIV